MDDLNRFGPELALLIAAGLVVILDVAMPASAAWAARRRAVSIVLGLVGVAGSVGWSLALILADERGDAFEGLLVVDDFSLFFNFLFAGSPG